MGNRRHADFSENVLNNLSLSLSLSLSLCVCVCVCVCACARVCVFYLISALIVVLISSSHNIFHLVILLAFVHCLLIYCNEGPKEDWYPTNWATLSK